MQVDQSPAKAMRSGGAQRDSATYFFAGSFLGSTYVVLDGPHPVTSIIVSWLFVIAK